MKFFRNDGWRSFPSRHRWSLFCLQAVVFLIAGGGIAWWFLASAASDSASKPSNPSASQQAGSMNHDHDGSEVHSASDTRPQWWTCAMHPQIRQQKPGKCPICRMELVPVDASAGGLRTLVIKPAVRELMKVRVAPVERRYVTAKVRMVGKVDFDETRLAHITAWVSGRLDRLFVDYTGVHVKKGDHLVYIYSEELYAIQEELIQAVRFQKESPRRGGLDLAEAAREKLRLLGLTEQQIREIESREKPQDHLTIYAPSGGIVIEKLKQEGDRVRTGDRIYTVADLTQVWVKLDAYESDLTWVRYGQKVKFTTEAYPGETFAGRIAFIDPVLNKKTRTVKVRVNVANPGGRLKPEMFVRAVVESKIASNQRVLDAGLAGKWISPMHPEIVKEKPGVCDICGMPLVRAETLGYVSADTDSQAKPLVIPVSAALVTGTRAIVYVEVPGTKEPTYEGREVLLGPRAGDWYIVRNGLFEGEKVVVHGAFKIDSALQIQAKPSMMTPGGGGGGSGHQHGSGTKNKSMSRSDTRPMQMELPDAFRQQLDDLVSTAQFVWSVAEKRDLESLREAFAKFRTALNRINAQGLEGRPAMLWKEFLMLLGNDAIEGAEATDLETALRAVDLLKKHIFSMQQKFMLTPMEQDSSGHASAVQAIPAVFRQQPGGFLSAYFQLQESLAADDVVATREAIGALGPALQAIDAASLDGATREVWQKEKRSLEQIVTRIGQATDIETARKEFALLSEQLLAVAQRFGVTGVFELHCPMAFGGRGASWLQKDDQVRNPYFGQSMLTCADRVKRLGPPSSEAPTHPEGDHE